MRSEILRDQNKILHTTCEAVTDFEEAKQIAEELVEVIKSVAKFWNIWLGFAANQIGYSKRIIVLRKGKDEYQILINPFLVQTRIPFPYLERCYSTSGIYRVKRYLWAQVKYQDLQQQWQEMILKGPSAVYHEIDHLEGILISEKGKRIF